MTASRKPRSCHINVRAHVSGGVPQANRKRGADSGKRKKRQVAGMLLLGVMNAYMYVHACMYVKRSKDVSELGLQREEEDMFAMAAGRTRVYAEGLAAEHGSFFWRASNLSKTLHGQPRQIVALTLTYHCDHCQCAE